MIALIDGDIVTYRSAASCEPTRIKPELEPLEAALLRADDLMKRILAETGADKYRVFISGDSNFRYDIDPNYKANRKDKPKPTWLQDVRAFLCTNWNAEICDGIEADDAMGIAQCAGWIPPHQQGNYEVINYIPTTTVCSIDKDLLQVPGNHYNFVTGVATFIDPLTGLKNFYQQLIQGDASDNIMGYDGKARPVIPKFLQPKIDELWNLTHEVDMYEHVKSMYYGADNNEVRLIKNARLLWIQRKENDEWNPIGTTPQT